MQTLTITAARYANPDHTGAILDTTESGAVAIGIDQVEAWAAMLAAVPVPDPYEHDLAFIVANARRRLISDGTTIVVDGVSVPTWADAATMASLSSLVQAAGIDPAVSVSWKGSDGKFYALDADGVRALFVGVTKFVQAVFAKEAKAMAKIATGKATLASVTKIMGA